MIIGNGVQFGNGVIITNYDLPILYNLYTWGQNQYGQLGNGSTIDGTSGQSSPGTVAGSGTTWSTVACAYRHTAAIKTDGTLWTWGWNSFGQLGNTGQASSPRTVAGGGTNWQQVSANLYNTAAIKTDGTLWTWGRNNSGQLGNGITNGVANSSPITTVNSGTTWSQVSVGSGHMAAVKTDGTLWAWGRNDFGQLGNGSTIANTGGQSTPGTVSGGGTTWKQVTCGYNRTAAIKTDGTLWTCGYNKQGQLGDGTTTNRSSLATVAGGGTTWKQVSAVGDHTAAIKTDGTLWTCGYNNLGQLGTGSTANTSSFVTVLGGGSNWSQISAATYHTAAIKTDGTLWTCGYNLQGQLGNGSTANTSSFATVAGGGTTWSQVAGLAAIRTS